MKNYEPFINDEEKMYDFHILTKQEFLESYSYLTEEEYDLTVEEVRKQEVEIEEMCPHCGCLNTVIWDGISRTTVCEECRTEMLLCSLCICNTRRCVKCSFEKELN